MVFDSVIPASLSLRLLAIQLCLSENNNSDDACYCTAIGKRLNSIYVVKRVDEFGDQWCVTSDISIILKIVCWETGVVVALRGPLVANAKKSLKVPDNPLLQRQQDSTKVKRLDLQQQHKTHKKNQMAKYLSVLSVE